MLKRLIIPGALFLLYLAVALVVGFLLLWGLPKIPGAPDLGEQTKKTDVVAPGGTTTTTETIVTSPGTPTPGTQTPGTQTTTTDVVAPGGTTTTTETTTATPLLVIAAALAAGGWLLIPLKYAWDEATKESQGERDELADQADDRRKIADKMRDQVHEGITSHWGPILFGEREVKRWAKRCSHYTPLQRAPLKRLLYSVALLEERFERLNEDGRPILLRSLKLERVAGEHKWQLTEFLYEILGDSEDAVGVLVAAVRWVQGNPAADQSAPRELASFAEFERRIKGKDQQWKRLRDVYSDFVRQCYGAGKLSQLSEFSEAAEASLMDGLNDVYKDWYRPEAEPVLQEVQPSV